MCAASAAALRALRASGAPFALFDATLCPLVRARACDALPRAAALSDFTEGDADGPLELPLLSVRGAAVAGRRSLAAAGEDGAAREALLALVRAAGGDGDGERDGGGMRVLHEDLVSSLPPY
jgi:hypothetical protein